MRITKYIHSCLLITEGDRTVLVDPGIYSWQSGLVEVNNLPQLEAIAVTHNHADHCSPDFIAAVRRRFPAIPIVTNTEVKQTLEAGGITSGIITENTAGIRQFKAPHEALPAGDPPLNSCMEIFGRLIHPGDSFAITRVPDILALPVTAPWGSATAAVRLALTLRPKMVIPIHDWHYHAEARLWLYDRLQTALGEAGIPFTPLTDSEAVEL